MSTDIVDLYAAFWLGKSPLRAMVTLFASSFIDMGEPCQLNMFNK